MLHAYMPNHTLTECASLQGYESCTEGDAFIMSFADPLTALHFCMDVQRDLLRAAWPSEVVGEAWASGTTNVFQPCVPTKGQGGGRMRYLVWVYAVPPMKPVPRSHRSSSACPMHAPSSWTQVHHW